MGKKIIAVFLTVVMTLSLVACDEEELPSAQELLNNVTEASADIRTLQFDFDMDITIDVTGETWRESGKVSINTNGSGAVDTENQQMKMAFPINIAIPWSDDIDMQAETYLVDNTLYLMVDIPGMGTEWMKQDITEEIPEEYPEQSELTELQTEFIEAAQVTVTGIQEVNGVDCYVMEATLDIEQLWQLVTPQLEAAGLEMDDFPEEMEGFLDAISFSQPLKIWIAKDTYYPTKVEMEMTVELTDELMGLFGEDGSVNMEMVMTILLYNYNQSVSIELPPEASEAIEITDLPTTIPF